jgi:hypothetical protein
VYVVIAVGETVSVDAVPPELQTYVDAPDAVSTSLFPMQIVPDAAVALTVGAGVTVMVRLVVPLDPQGLDAYTVTLPEVFPAVTFIEVVPCPELIIVPDGVLHV